MSARRISQRTIIPLILILLPLVYFFPAVKGDVLLATGDAWAYSLPVRMLLGQMIRNGSLPLWNPHTFGGMPLLASVQPGVLYPLNWLFAVLPPGVAMNAVTILTFHLALIGSYLYGRAVQMNRVGALVTALAFTFGGFMIGHLEMTNYIAAAAWLPWILLAVERQFRSDSLKESWRWAALGAFFIALQCYAGLPQATWQTILVCAPYFLFSLWLRDDAPALNFRLRFIASISVMAAGGALLSAIQLLPAIELQRQGERAAIPYEAFAAYPMAPRFLLSLVFPYFFGGGQPPLYHLSGWDEWWLVKSGHGYVGMLGLLLLLLAWFGSPRKRIVWFWTVMAVMALLLSLGDDLPFNLNHLLYRVPVYNLFRGSYRHTFEFTFAAAVLAGLGATAMAKIERRQARRMLLRSSAVLTMIVIATALTFRFFAQYFSSPAMPAPDEFSLTRAEALVPLILCALSLCVGWLSANKQTRLMKSLLVTLLFVDLASFGWFTHWRSTQSDQMKQLDDSAAMKVIKARADNQHSFRVISQAVWPYGENYSAISHANLAMVRGLDSVSGYDPMRLPLPAALAGRMDIFGTLRDADAYGLNDQGLNLLNVRYLLRERSSRADEKRLRGMRNGEVYFDGILAEMKLAPGGRLTLEADGFAADELTIISSLMNGAHFEDGTPVASIRLSTTDGRVIEKVVQAGRDTAEWAWERADLRATAKHHKASVIQSSRAKSERGDFTVHHYLARFTFDRSAIDYVELESLQPQAELMILRMNLKDSSSGDEAPLDRQRLSPERWRLVERCGEADLYENLKAMPRAWFVEKVSTMSAAEALKTIRTGKHSDGVLFDPQHEALLETGLPTPSKVAAEPGQQRVTVTRYESSRIEFQASTASDSFLVLSEIDYPGWQARVDGQETTIYRTDYALRGIVVPAGNHRLEFSYRPMSLYKGAMLSATGLLMLLAGMIITGRRAAETA